MATISELIHLMKMRRMAGESPYNLVLGSDIQDMSFSQDFFTEEIFSSFSKLSSNERFTLLSAYIAKKHENKYSHLANLIVSGYFDVIVTTDPTNELQTALLDSGVSNSDLDVIILGYDKKVENRLTSRKPKIKIVKLRGDLLLRSLDNFIPSDALKVNEAYESQISSLIQTDAILLGLKNIDYDIFRYIRNNDGAIWFIQKALPESGEMLDAFIRSRHFTNLIVAPYLFPEKIFELIENGLELPVQQSSDELIASKENPSPLLVESVSINNENSGKNTYKTEMIAEKRPMKIFISYSHKDEEFKDELITMLAGLQRRGVINAWQDRRIEEGDEWYQEIQDAMNDSDLAILLVSASFIASRFIQDEELPKLLKRRIEGGLRVVPVIVRSCLWQSEPVLKDLQGLPRDGKPVITFSRDNGDRDQVWTDIAKAIERRAKL